MCKFNVFIFKLIFSYIVLVKNGMIQHPLKIIKKKIKNELLKNE